MTAHFLTRMGVRDVVLVEKSALAGGVTGRSGAQLIPRSEHPVIARLKWEGLEFFRNFEARTGGSANFQTTGYLALMGGGLKSAAGADLGLLQQSGSRARVIQGSDILQINRELAVDSDDLALHVPEAGYCDPVSAVQALAASARGLGARVAEFTCATAIRVERGAVAGVITDAGEVSTRRIVLAANIWTNALLEPLGSALPLYWHRVEICYYRRPARVGTHPIVADFASRCYFRPDGADLTFIGNIPEMHAGVHKPEGLEDIDHPDRFQQGVSPATICSLYKKLVRRIPAFSEGYWRRGHACVYDVSPDWHPMLALPHRLEGLCVAAGFSGHGFVMSPAAGRMLAEAVTGETKDREAAALLSPDRFANNRPVVFEQG